MKTSHATTNVVMVITHWVNGWLGLLECEKSSWEFQSIISINARRGELRFKWECYCELGIE